MLTAAGGAWAADPTALDVAMKSLHAALPPRVVQDELILSVQPAHPARFVGVRFAHESWSILHPYELNENGVFVLDYPIPEGLREIRYRIVVDGELMTDPSNPVTDQDSTGSVLSVFTLEKDPVRPILNPRQERDGSVTFVFRGTAGKRVSLVGDFNNWDPYMDFLAEDAPGSYSITLRVPAGTHWYYFSSEGRRILDMFNAASAVAPGGAAVSIFTLPS
jgi:1,4-alpha-glucan branching enzyme